MAEMEDKIKKNKLDKLAKKIADKPELFEGKKKAVPVKRLEQKKKPSTTRIKGTKEVIKTKEPMKLIKGEDFTKKIAKLREARKAAKEGTMTAAKTGAKSALKKASKTVLMRGLKSIPFLGSVIGIGQALKSGDVSAAVPEEIRPTAAGPKKGSVEAKLESGKKLTAEEKEHLKSLAKKAAKRGR
jgi:hydroxyethylthiazole kinase-like sugar kinase family protein